MASVNDNELVLLTVSRFALGENLFTNRYLCAANPGEIWQPKLKLVGVYL